MTLGRGLLRVFHQEEIARQRPISSMQEGGQLPSPTQKASRIVREFQEGVEGIKNLY